MPKKPTEPFVFKMKGDAYALKRYIGKPEDWPAYVARQEARGIRVVKLNSVPSDLTIARAAAEASSVKTPDGCRVEPDGHCSHGFPSWALVKGFI